DGSFSMFNGDIYAKLKKKLPVSVYENVDGKDIFMGQFYLDTWKNITDETMQFTAVDIIGVLGDTDFDGIFWEEPVTLSSAMSQIFTPVGVVYELDSKISGNLISGWIPPGTYRDALQQICFASRASARTSRSSSLILEPTTLPVGKRDYVVTRDNSKQNDIEALSGV